MLSAEGQPSRPSMVAQGVAAPLPNRGAQHLVNLGIDEADQLPAAVTDAGGRAPSIAVSVEPVELLAVSSSTIHPARSVNTLPVPTSEASLALAEAKATRGGKAGAPRGKWVSLGSEAEISAEHAGTTVPRALLEVQHTIRREVLYRNRVAPQKFVAKDASEDSRDLRGVPNELYTVLRDVVDCGVQAVPQRESASTQTPFFRKVEACVQAEPTLVDARVVSGRETKALDPQLRAFFDKALPQTLHCLTLNDEVPIYTDDFLAFAEDEALVTSRDDVFLVEKGNYAHSLTRGRQINSVDWRSSRPRDDLIAIATTRACSFAERLVEERMCKPSINVVWALSDPMHPRYFLEAPKEVYVLRFNPAKPNLIVGGGANGQVFLWDLDRAAGSVKAAAGVGEHGSTGVGASGLVARQAKIHGDVDVSEIPAMAEQVKGVGTRMDGDVPVPLLQPTQISRIEHSHRRGVHDICWLPDGIEVGFDGQQTVTESGTQFASISDDGAVCIWDIRRDHLSLDKLRKLKHQSRIGGDDIQWVPLHRYQIARLDGSGDIMGFRLHVSGLTHLGTPSYTLACGSSGGELAVCSIAPKEDNRPSNVAGSRDAKLVRFMTSAHTSAAYCVQGHPQIGDVYLTCGDYTFKIWRSGLSNPIYVSATFSAPVTCARWSPTRPAIVFVGTGDGKVQVWDLLDRGHEPVLSHQLIQDAITCMEFKPITERQRRGSYGGRHGKKSKARQQLLIGTKLGSFHWYMLPMNLVRAHGSERRQMRAMLEREVRRVAYYLWRWSEREKELDRYGTGAPKINLSALAHRAVTAGTAELPHSKVTFSGVGAAPDAATHRDAPHDYSYDIQRDADFLELVERLQKERAEELEVME